MGLFYKQETKVGDHLWACAVERSALRWIEFTVQPHVCWVLQKGWEEKSDLNLEECSVVCSPSPNIQRWQKWLLLSTGSVQRWRQLNGHIVTFGLLPPSFHLLSSGRKRSCHVKWWFSFSLNSSAWLICQLCDIARGKKSSFLLYILFQYLFAQIGFVLSTASDRTPW